MDDPRWHIHSAEHQVISSGSHYRWHNRPRDDDSLVIKLIRSGSLPFRRGERQEDIAAQSVFHFAHGEDSDYGFDHPVPETIELSYLSLRGAGLKDYWQWFDQRCGQHWSSPANTALKSILNDLINQFHHQPHSRDHGPRIHQFLMTYSDCQDQHRQQQLSPINLALEEVHDAPLAITSIHNTARRYGLSREHLSRCFQQRYGCSAQEWLALARLDHAQQLLKDSDLSASQIAHICGYSSSNVLARALRGRYGQGPRALRQRLRQQFSRDGERASGQGSGRKRHENGD